MVFFLEKRKSGNTARRGGTRKPRALKFAGARARSVPSDPARRTRAQGLQMNRLLLSSDFMQQHKDHCILCPKTCLLEMGAGGWGVGLYRK